MERGQAGRVSLEVGVKRGGAVRRRDAAGHADTGEYGRVRLSGADHHGGGQHRRGCVPVPHEGGRDGGGDRRRAGDVDAGRAAHDAGAERQGAVGAVFHGGRGQRGALLGPGFRGRLGIRHRRGAGEQRGDGKAHQGAAGRHRARSGGRELRHDGGRRGDAVRSTGFAAGNQRGEHQVAGDAVQRPPQREGRGL